MNQYMFTCPAEKQNYKYFYAGATIVLCMGDQAHKFGNYAQNYLQIIVLLREILVGLLNKRENAKKKKKKVCMNVR